MKNWDKGKKDHRRPDDRDFDFRDSQKKKKLKPVEKIKYRLRGAEEQDD